MKNSLAVVFLTFLFSLPVISQNREQCYISGTIVDITGQPVADSYLHWYPEYDGGIDFISIFGKSGKDGRFQYQEDCPIQSQTLYTTSPLSFDNYTPLLPPFAYGSRLAKKVKGFRTVKNKKGDLDLGKVPIQIYYSTVSLRFVNASDANLFAAQSDWENALIRISDEKGIVFSQQPITADQIKKAVRVKNSAVIADLPEGDWKIEIRLNQEQKFWLKPDKLVNVKRSENTPEILLKMIEKK